MRTSTEQAGTVEGAARMRVVPEAGVRGELSDEEGNGGAVRRAAVLCSTSFLNLGTKVGMQFIAEGLARRGWEVHYISAPSSPLDMGSKSRRGRFGRAWLGGRSKRPVRVAERLWEYVFRAPGPVDRRCLRFDWQLAGYRAMAPAWLARERFDLCVHDSSPALIYRPLVQATHHVLRLSDILEGFGHLGEPVKREFRRNLRAGVYSTAWAVSEGLLDYARQLRPDLDASIIPNGVEAELFRSAGEGQRLENSAVFLGSAVPWVDVRLMAAAARRLPGWRFDVYGAMQGGGSGVPENVRYHGSVPYAEVPELLSRYEVGLIPFRDVRERLEVCERPLKFYQYLAAGLGVAASDVGGLRAGMGSWACYGNNAEEFSAAIVAAQLAARTRDGAAVRRYVEAQSWEARAEQVMESLARLYPRVGAETGSYRAGVDELAVP